MVAYIRSDLEFILKQIKISEAHTLYIQSGGTQGAPLFGPSTSGNPASIPSYNIAWGLRTVDGTYNHLLPGQENQGAADQEFPEGLGTQFRTIMVDPDGDGPMGPMPVSYQPGVDNDGPGTAGPGDVFDPTVRTISNLLVDQTPANIAATMAALQKNDAPGDHLAIAIQIKAAYDPLIDEFKAVEDATDAYAEAQAAADAANPPDPLLDAAAAAALAALQAAQVVLADARAVPGGLDELLAANGIELEGANVKLTNVAPDEGLSASFNSWFTLFGQFFDHGLDLVAKGGSGTVFIPLMPDDPLFDAGADGIPGNEDDGPNFMVLTRATLAGPGADGVLGTADDTDRPINNTTSFVDQNQTYASHASHQVFLRQYELNANGDPVATGRLLVGAGPDGIRGNADDKGMATWADLKAQAADLLGIQLLDSDVGNIPLLATDEYGNFIRGPNGYPQIVFPGANPGDPPILVEGDPAANGGLGVLVTGAIRTGHAFLADIAHNAVPDGLADGDIEVGLGNADGTPATDAEYDNELLDAHFMAGDGRANENIGLTAVHHVFHSEHNRLVEHTKEVILATGDAAFIAEWQLPDGSWNGERLFQAAKFGTEMQYQHLVFEEFARKVQPAINTFLVPDGFDTTMDPSIVAEFAHVVYRFGHSMLTESIDRFDPTFQPDHITLIEGFLNPLQYQNNGTTSAVDADIAAGAIIRGMTRQVGNEIDEFVTGALRNNLLGLPLDLATINLARGRDTGVPGLNEVREQFYAASNQNILLKPYESWTDYAGHLKHESSIINFIAAYGILNGGSGNDTLNGGTGGGDRAVFSGTVGNYNFALAGGLLAVTDLVGTDGTDTLNSVEQLAFAGGAVFNLTTLGTAGNNPALNGDGGANLVLGFGGTDTLNGNGGNDALVGGVGTDTVNGGTGNDTIVWNLGDGADVVDGGANTDTFRVNGSAAAETFRVYARIDALAAGMTLNANTEIVVTLNGTNNASIIAQLDNVEDIVINGLGGGDTFLPIGNFAPTSLATSTITFGGSEADDTLNLEGLTSDHRVLFLSGGGTDSVIGTLRPQDEFVPLTGIGDMPPPSTSQGMDWNADGQADLLFQHANGQAGVVLQEGGAPVVVGPNPGGEWTARGTGDFNGDGQSDILWQHDGGQAAVWIMEGTTPVAMSRVGPNPGAAWTVRGAADFNGDQQADILWQHESGLAAIWMMDGLNPTEMWAVNPNPGSYWTVYAAEDINGDRLADILWEHDNGEQFAGWLMEGPKPTGMYFIEGPEPATNPSGLEAWQLV